MKKIICIVLSILLLIGLCSCSSTPPEDAECIGYVIIPHADGDEHADIYKYIVSNGTICAYCLDGRKVVSTNITIIENS